jgi:hypothetical protein
MDWEVILRDSVKEGNIRALHLTKIPVLKNCTNWRDVEILGEIDYQSKKALYQGVLVKLKGKIYFVTRPVFYAVSEYLNIKRLHKITVVL